MTHLSTATVHARRAHWCDACCEAIPKGSAYVRTAWAGEGTVWTWRQHPACSEILGAIFHADPYAFDDGAPQGWLKNMYADEMPEGLSEPAQAKWAQVHAPGTP